MNEQVDNVGVHAAHCCAKHGCKYGNDECPVQAGNVKQEHPCEYCDMDDEAAAPVVDKIVKWLEGHITELENVDTRIAGYIRQAGYDRAHNYRDVVRGLREGAWKA